MTMTSESRKNKRGSIGRLFPPGVGGNTGRSASLNPLTTRPTSSSSGASPAPPKVAFAQTESAIDDDVRPKAKPKMKLVPIIANNKPQAYLMVAEDKVAETESRLAANKKSAKRTPVSGAPPLVEPKKASLAPPPKKDEEVLSSKTAKAALKQKLKEIKEEIPQVPQKPRGVRTFRIWHPNTKGKTLRVRVGPTGSTEILAEEVFDLKNIQAKTYEAWKREAKMHLPSATGGAAVENLQDVINIVPTVQKEGDPKVVENTMKRLSMDAAAFDGNKKRKSSLKETKWSLPTIGAPDSDSSEEEDEDDEDDEDDDSSDEVDYTVIEIDSDEEDGAAERKVAGMDIRGKLQTLKELTENLSHKRVIRQQLVQKATGHTVLDAEEIPLKEHILYLVEYMGNYIHDMLSSFTFWSKSLTEINGRYGVIVASYFIWLRRMVILNAVTCLLTLCIIIAPQIVEDQDYAVVHNHTGIPDFSLIDFIHGEHSLHHSYLFYSGYKNRNEDSPLPFTNPAVRFLTVMILVFLVNVYFIFSLINTFYRGIRMESTVAGASNNHHFVCIVCGWNFSCGDEQAALYLRKTICRELHILANASNEEEGHTIRINKQNKRLLSFFVQKLGLRAGTFAMHTISSLLVLLCCFILGIIMFSLCQFKLDYYLKCIGIRDDGKSREHRLMESWVCKDGSLSLEVWVMALPALFIAVVTLCLDWIVTKIIGDMESWASTERNVYAKMFRAGLLYGTNLQVIYWFWERQEEKMKEEGFSLETIFGKELYRIVVIQGMLDTTINFVVRWLHHRIRKRRDPLYMKSEFPTEHCTLGMFFLHSLALMGPLFSPGLGLLITLRLILDFYRHRYALFHFHSNDGYASHASSVYGPYLVTYFLTFLLTSFMNIYYMSVTSPSPFEGPFVKYFRYDDALSHLFSDKSGFAWLKLLGQPGFLMGFLSLLLALVYFNWQWSKAYEPIIQQLNDTIFLERADREILLKAIFEIAQATRFGASAMPSTASKLKAKKQAKLAPTDKSASSAIPTSTEVSDAEEAARKRKSVPPEQPTRESAGTIQKRQMQALRKLMDQVKVDQPENTTLTGLQKQSGRKSVAVDTWNAQRHRRDAMEKIVKGVVGSRRNARYDPATNTTLAYDPTNKIFKKNADSGTASGSSSNSQAPKAKKRQSNIAILNKIAERAATPSKPLQTTKAPQANVRPTQQSQPPNQQTPTGRKPPSAPAK